MDEAGLSRKLATGEIVRLTAPEREKLEMFVEVIDTLGASLGRQVTIVRIARRLAALEQSRTDEWVLRPLGGEDEARAFLKQRSEEYERMWDGCGCRIEYYR